MPAVAPTLFECQSGKHVSGEKTAVILPIEEFQEILEDIEDLAIVAQRREEPTISYDALVAELKQDRLT